MPYRNSQINMKIYKDKQFLVFDFEDGKNVKYDFATKTAIGKKGKPVANLCSQLSGLTINELIDCCKDVQYGKFLKFVKVHGDYNNRGIYNIGTILSRVPKFAKFEQIFSAGIEDIVDSRFKYSINDIPKALIKLCKTHKIIDNKMGQESLTGDINKIFLENKFSLWTKAIGLTDDEIQRTIRISLSEEIDIKQIDEVVNKIKNILQLNQENY